MTRFPFNFDGLMAIGLPAITGFVLEQYGWPLPTTIGLMAIINFVLVLAIELEATGKDQRP